MSLAVQKKDQSLLRSERIAGGILPRVLTSFDLVAIFVVIVLFITNASISAQHGPVAYIYWGLGFISFLIPAAIVTGQLGLLFPGEGSIYVWTTKAFGDFLGFLAGFCAWWPVVLTLVAASDNAVSFIQRFGQLFHVTILNNAGTQGLVIILIIVFSFLLSVLRFRITQNMVNTIFVIYGGAILLIGLAGLLWLWQGHVPNTDFSLRPENWMPGWNNITLYGAVILALLGIEVPLNMGVEIRDIRSIKRYLFWGSLVVIVAYLIATFGVMVAAPAGLQGSPTSLVDAIQKGFGPVGTFMAALADLIFVGFFIFAAAVYNYSFGRLIFVSGLNRRLPAVMSKVNANKVPWVAVLVQSTISALLTIIIFLLVPVFIPNSDPLMVSNDVFVVLSAAIMVYWSISTIFIFVDVIAIRQKYRNAFNKRRLTSDWVLYLCALVGIPSGIWGVVCLFTSSWTPDISRPLWDAWIAILSVIALIAAVAVFSVGQRTLQNNLSDEEIIAEVTR